MTFPLKENLIHFEALAARQHRIYNDACDFGVKIDAAEKGLARNLLVELIRFYGAKITRWGVGNRSHGSNTKLFIPNEHDNEGSIVLYGGIVLDVSFNYDVSRDIEFLSIEITNARLGVPDAVANYNSKQV